jgi:protein-tyrosine phosphatase
MSDRSFHVTVVCTGNICRSPMGEVILRDLFREAGLDVTVDSAGTTRWEVGSPMDRRAVAELRRRGGGTGAAALCGGGGQGDALLLHVPTQA